MEQIHAFAKEELGADGMNYQMFLACVEGDHTTLAHIKSEYKKGVEKGLRGSPTTFIIRHQDGKQIMIAGAVPYESLAAMIESTLQGVVKEGTSGIPEKLQNSDDPLKSIITTDRLETDQSLLQIKSKANLLYERKIDQMLAEVQELRNIIKEQQTQINYLTSLIGNIQTVSTAILSSINTFIAYGVDENTKKLGAGERAAVMHSFKSAFGKLPEREDEFEDVIKIANGRWPSLRSEAVEQSARRAFRFIYQRDADMNDPHDNAAVTVMAYGLRQRAENRNLESEQAGIAIFRKLYGRLPSSTEDWNIMQAITYSGAAR